MFMTKNLYLCDKETMYTYEINFDENVLKEQINNLLNLNLESYYINNDTVHSTYNRYTNIQSSYDLIVYLKKTFLENVVSNADYTFLKKQLKKDGNMQWYFVVWYLGATGARVSELIRIKIEHVNLGYFDLYSKGGKLRRLYIPKKLREETQKWLLEEQRTTGYLFLNRFGERITTRGISQQLKNYADKYGLDSKVIYPHSFRHLYAKNFLEKYNDIALLADLMGHESIETTRIYLRRTATEQQSLIDKIVTW